MKKIFMNIRFWVVVLLVVLPLIVLYFDLQLYLNYVSERRRSDENPERVFLVNISLIQKIKNELESKKVFLGLPVYPLLKEPF